MLGVGWNWLVLLAILAASVWSGGFRAVDATALDAAQSVRAPAFDVFASLVGVFGRAEVSVGIAVGLAAARWRASPRDALAPLLIGVTIVVETLLKLAVPQAPPPEERSRAIELLPYINVPFAHAFPSGHVARTAFLLRIARSVPTWVVVVVIVLMVTTRLYLGEHWLSDVAGGLALGLGVANVARILER